MSVSLSLAGTDAEGQPARYRQAAQLYKAATFPAITLLFGFLIISPMLFGRGSEVWVFIIVSVVAALLGYVRQTAGARLCRLHGVRFPAIPERMILYRERGNLVFERGIASSREQYAPVDIIVTTSELWITHQNRDCISPPDPQEYRIKKADLRRLQLAPAGLYTSLGLSSVNVIFEAKGGYQMITLQTPRQDRFVGAVDQFGEMKAAGQVEEKR